MSLIVRRGTFIYDGDHFQVQPEEIKPNACFPRHDTASIRALLTPASGGGDAVAETSGRTGTRGSRGTDKPPAFYRAQLAHYGLKDFKTRDAAKKALLRAIEASGSDGLAVPSNISQIEQELKTEWLEKSEAAMEEAHQARQRRVAEAQAKVRKRFAENRALIKEIKGIKIPESDEKTMLDLKKLSGRYEIFARELEDYNIHPDESYLDLALSNGESHLWGKYEFGPSDGWFRSHKLISTQIALGGKICGYWRTDNPKDEDEWCASPDNTLVIVFLGDGRIRGQISACHMGTFTFVGRESTQPSPYDRDRQPVWEWKEQWKDVGEDARRSAPGGRKRKAPEVTSDTGSEPDASSDFGQGDCEDRAKDEKEEREKDLARKAAAATLATKTFSEYDRNKKAKKAKGERADRLVPSDLEGQYTILSTGLDNWEAPYDGRVLEFALSRGKSHLWAKFDFGLYTGYVRSEALESLPTSAGATISCYWRGEDAGSGEMTFDESVNTFVITFLGGGKMTAEMGSEFGTFSLVGTKRDASMQSEERPDVDDWKDSWKGYNSSSYEAASRSRWGGYGGDDDGSQEENSDTDREPEEPYEVVDLTNGAL